MIETQSDMTFPVKILQSRVTRSLQQGSNFGMQTHNVTYHNVLQTELFTNITARGSIPPVCINSVLMMCFAKQPNASPKSGNHLIHSSISRKMIRTQLSHTTHFKNHLSESSNFTQQLTSSTGLAPTTYQQDITALPIVQV